MATTTDGWTAQDHRNQALRLLDDVGDEGLQDGSPRRASMLREAQVHATLALSAPATNTLSGEHAAYVTDGASA